jgi:hypothetical protein
MMKQTFVFHKVSLYFILLLVGARCFAQENLYAPCTKLNQEYSATLKIRQELQAKQL